MPSHVEGFGMPVREAMACGCPVIVSDDAALVEVAGEAAFFAKPLPGKPLQGLREGMETLLQGSPGRSARMDLKAKGLERARAFTWEQTAEATRASYEKALAE